jgi:hypothetical protein
VGAGSAGTRDGVVARARFGSAVAVAGAGQATPAVAGDEVSCGGVGQVRAATREHIQQQRCKAHGVLPVGVPGQRGAILSRKMVFANF